VTQGTWRGAENSLIQPSDCEFENAKVEASDSMHFQSQHEMTGYDQEFNKENVRVSKPNRYRKKTSIPLASFKSDESTDSNSPNRKTPAFNNNNKVSEKIACLKVIPPQV
jgi:hypothetical protein